jgi:hypothetical protein
MSKHPSLTYVVRQRVTVARHLDRFADWMKTQQLPALRKDVPELAGVRHYKEEKDELVRLTFFDLAEDTRWTPSTRDVGRRIRDSWSGFAPDMRDFSGQLFSLISTQGPGTKTDADHPLIVERLSVVADKETEWNQWSERMWAEEIRDVPIASVARYWALEGEPRFYLQIQEFEDDPTMRTKIKSSEPNTRPQYWGGWAKFMPYVENLGRYVFLPVKS